MIFPLLVVFALVTWNVLRWPAVRGRRESLCEEYVSVLIPARDEEANIAACIDSVVSQDCVAEVVVYNDHSSDRTGEIVVACAALDPRVRVAATEPLPPGWFGKTFACSRLAAQARREWLLFIDADARLLPGAVPRMIAEARARSATLLSCWPGLEMRGFWERLLMPLLNFVVLTAYPAPLAFIRREPSLGLAHGACILASRRAYDNVGGHAAVASEVFEDTRLAQRWRERGERSLCVDGQQVVRVRMYSGFPEIWSGFQKNFRGAFRTSLAFWSFVTIHAVFFLGPFLLARPAGLVVIAARFMLAFRFRHPLWSALLHPAGECVLLALALSSWRAWRSPGGIAWKGRRYQHT
jgi:cellulose synthase/poly-beta-1,6-N-acetylglucosamine synthase-like glycosyltransferase